VQRKRVEFLPRGGSKRARTLDPLPPVHPTQRRKRRAYATLIIRVPPPIHRWIKQVSAKEGITMNAWVCLSLGKLKGGIEE
jgi:hypothetical protein